MNIEVIKFGELQLSLFADDMILKLKDLIDSTKGHLDLIDILSKLIAYKNQTMKVKNFYIDQLRKCEPRIIPRLDT